MKTVFAARVCVLLSFTVADLHFCAADEIQSVSSRLSVIADEAARNEVFFENLYVTGKINTEPFRLTIEGSNCRYHREVNTENGKVESYALDDGQAYFTSSGEDLVLDSAAGTRENLSKRVARSFWGFLHPPFEHGELSTVSRYCRQLAELIEDGRGFGEEGPLTIELEEIDDEVCINLAVTFEQPPRISKTQVKTVKLVIDTSKGYLMTEFNEVEQSPLGPHISLTEKRIQVDVEEIAPGVFFPKKGSITVRRSGADMEARGEASHGTDTLEIESVEFGELNLEDDYFDVHRWPGARVGMKVHDTRFDPPVDFVYAEGPFDEAVLNRAARLRSPDRNLGTWQRALLILGNIGIIIGLTLIWFIKRKR